MVKHGNKDNMMYIHVYSHSNYKQIFAAELVGAVVDILFAS